VGLANIVWEKCNEKEFFERFSDDGDVWGGYPMVELLQENMTASSVRNELKMLLFDDSKRAEIEKRLSMIADFLRQDGDSITKIVRFLV
jgi:lipid A disaccharide synthetase